jgi:lipoprotein signal peptidase
MPSPAVHAHQARAVSPLRSFQTRVALWTLLGVAALDQGAKWWAWRHVSDVKINLGGNALVGKTVGHWIADPLGGALFDVLGAAVFATGFFVLMRRRLPTSVLVLGALMLSGWSSNLLDRLGLHSATAPGSGRGAVDFMHIGRHFYNLADFVIIASTPLLFAAVLVELLRRQFARSAPTRDPGMHVAPSLVGASHSAG